MKEELPAVDKKEEASVTKKSKEPKKPKEPKKTGLKSGKVPRIIARTYKEGEPLETY